VLALVKAGNTAAAIAQIKVAPSVKDLLAFKKVLAEARLVGRWRDLDAAVDDNLALLAAPRLLKPGSGDGFLRIGPKPNPDALPAAVDENGDAIAPDVATGCPGAADRRRS
jgi:hypothetical protein